jgi:UbiA prenyltransferase family
MALAKLSRPRYLAIQLTPFLVAAAASPDGRLVYGVLGALAIVAWKVIASLANIISDRSEDAIDHPTRTTLVESAGLHTLVVVVWTTCLVYVAIVVVMVSALQVPLDTAFLWLCCLVAGLAYSFLRVKKSTIGVPILLGSESAIFMWVGWHGQGGTLDWLGDIHLSAVRDLGLGDLLTGDTRLVLPAALALWIFGATLCGSKDVPNIEGDATVGYRSIYWRIVAGQHPVARVLAVMTVPYAFVALVALYGYDPPGAAPLAIYPCAIALAVILVRADTRRERDLVHASGYVYWQIFMSAVLFSVYPRAGTAAVLVGSLLWWGATSRLLHPDPTPSHLGDLRLLFALLMRDRTAPALAARARGSQTGSKA